VDRAAENALLEAQMEALRSDERLIEQGRRALSVPVEERLRQAWSLCKSGGAMLERVPEDVRARVRALDNPPPESSAPILLLLARTPYPPE
jgi:hypothetical protein